MRCEICKTIQDKLTEYKGKFICKRCFENE